jgi:hypothetical protein
MEKLSLLFRAKVIAGSNKNLTPDGARYKRLEQIALRELNEAVDQALQDYAEMMK